MTELEWAELVFSLGMIGMAFLLYWLGYRDGQDDRHPDWRKYD